MQSIVKCCLYWSPFDGAWYHSLYLRTTLIQAVRGAELDESSGFKDATCDPPQDMLYTALLVRSSQNDPTYGEKRFPSIEFVQYRCVSLAKILHCVSYGCFFLNRIHVIISDIRTNLTNHSHSTERIMAAILLSIDGCSITKTYH